MARRNWLFELVESYLFILTLAITGGILFNSHIAGLADYSTIFLGIIFFFTALKIDLKEAAGFLTDKAMIIVVNVFMLLVLPAAVFYITNWLYPALAVPFLILAAMPTGMTAPLLAEIAAGKQSLALVFAITTSLLAPFTIPLVLKLFAGAAVSVSFLSMFLSLAKVIFIPFILANFIKYFWQAKIKATYYTFKPISIVMLGLLIMGIVAKQAEQIMGSLKEQFLLYIIPLFILFIALHAVGFVIIFWRPKADRITLTICLTYMNFTLAVYLAGEFFPEPAVAVPIILSVLPWSLLLIPFKYIAKKI